MNNSFRMVGKRALTVAVAAATILWSIGLSAFVPLSASAATAGDLVRGTTLSTLYFYAADGKRYAFPNQKTYQTWFADFSGVKTLSDSELAAIPLAGNIVYRPGSRWIKITSDAKTYAVSTQGQIRWIESEAVATGLAGSDWNTMIDDVADVFFVDYTVGPSLTSAADAYNGALVSMGGSDYVVWNGAKRMVTATGFSGNWFQTRSKLDGTGITLAGLTTGTSVTAKEAALTDVAQIGATVTGGLSVSLASDTAASVTVPGLADSVAFAKFKLTANAGSVNLNQVIVTLGGVGATSNIDEVYLYEGDVRLTDGRTVNSSTRKATFSGLNLSLNSGESIYLTVKADVADANGGDTASFSIAANTDLVGTATVSGNFPVSGNTMTFSDTNAGSVTVTKNGTISNPTIGADGVTIAKFTIDANTEDATIKAITVNVDNSADHSNFKLKKGSTVLATGVVSGDLVTFTLSTPVVIEEGDEENFEVLADIGGEDGDSIIVTIEESADIVAIGGDYGFNLSVNVTSYDDSTTSCTDCSRSTIQGGDLTFAFNGPSADDIQIDGKDQVLLSFSVTAEQFVEIQEVVVNITGSNLMDGTEGNFQDINLRKSSGTVWMGPEELTGTNDNDQDLTFEDDQTLNAGETVDLMVTADVVDDGDAAADDTVVATLVMASVVAEDLNGDVVDDIVPGSSIVGNTMTLADASLTVQVSTPPSSGTYVKGSQNIPVVGFSFEAGDTSDVTVTDFTLYADGDADGTWSDEDDIDVSDTVNSCSLYDSESGALVDGAESFDSGTETAEFTDFDWTIEAGETKKLIVKCNFANLDQATGGADDDYVFYVEAASDIEAEDEDGQNVDAGTITDAQGNDPTGAETVVISIADSGSLAIALDGASADSTIILGSSTGVAVSKFKFTATNENFTVKELTLDNCVRTGADADGDCSDGVAGADDVAATLKLSYQNQAGATVTKSAFLSGNTVTVSGLDFYVPSGATRVLTITADTNSVSSQSASSGDAIQINLDAEASGTATFEAVGTGGETITETDVDTYVTANDMVLRKTKPTISLASGSPSGAAVPGMGEVLRFNVAADSRGYVTLDAVVFNVLSTDSGDAWNECDDTYIGAAAGWEVYDLADPSTKIDDNADWTFRDGAADNCENGNDMLYAELDFEGSSTNPAEEIGAGETKTYVVRVNTSGAAVDDTIQVSIPDEAQVDALTGVTAIPSAIRWDDDNEGDNINGSLVKNLPVTGGALRF